MNNLKMLSKAEAARRKLYVLRQSLGTRAGIPPEVENLLPALPGDNVKKLQSARQGRDCDVDVKDVQGPEGSKPEELWIALFKGDEKLTEYKQVPFPNVDFKMILPGLHTATPGPFRMKYIVDYGGVQNISDESLFYIDNVPPNHGNPGGVATPPDEVIDGVLTREILDAGEYITMTVPAPDDVAQGDIYRGYYGRLKEGILVDIFIVEEDSTSPILMNIPTSLIKGVGEGEFNFYCVYQDRVGNVGKDGEPFKFTVELTPRPSGLQPPEVPVNDDGVTDLKDAYPVLDVVIPTFDNGLPTDKAVVTFDGKPQTGIPTDGTSEVIVSVPFADVALGGDGPREATVTYAIVRNGKEFPGPTGVTVDIDFTIPGPSNPQPDPDLGNPNLGELVVKGSSKDDELVEDDIGTDVDIDLDLPTGLKATDVITLVWEGQKVAAPEGVYTVTGLEDPDFKVPLTLKSEVFEATKNGRKTARYVITNPANGENENPSLPTPVKVAIYPVSLPAPVIQHLYTNPGGIVYLNCNSLRDIPVIGSAAVVRVAGGGSLVADMKLDFVWSRSKLEPGAPDIEDYTFEKQLQGSEHLNGFEVYLPFADALRPIKDGNGKIVYSTVIDGDTHSSAEQAVRVVVADFDGKYCDGSTGA
ncbi:hypothetical protein [Pseudomonas sp. VE 196-7]|uniref:hypothetical protein n=1 Tax=Pseudomonas sp. VE 196-7 TaxID=2956726 RepID=UPI0021D4FD0F|nr:hypothetical protein [Pseudomonas sp. VE 196-7]MCU7214514.1 hypothetical protein [Pseudomonas sp. VE 196-7]